MIVTVWPFPPHKRMTVFTIHEPPAPPIDRIDRAEAMVFLKDGFSWSAFLLGPIWLLANRLWLATLGYIAIVAFAYVVFELMGVSEGLFGPFLLAMNATVGFEAHWLKSARLEAMGWCQVGSVSGQSLAECERRFFEGWLPTQSLLRRDGGIAGPSATQQDGGAAASPGHAASAATANGAAEATPHRRFAFLRRTRKG